MTLKFASRVMGKASKDVFDMIDDRVAELKEQGVEVINFGVGDPAKTYSPSEKIIEALTPAAHLHKNDGYPGCRGMESFRQTAASYMQRKFGVHLDHKTEINISIGSKEAIFHFPLLFIEPGDIALVPTPGYPSFQVGVKTIGGIPYFLPLLEKNNFLPDFKSLPKDVVQKAKFIWISYPNAPTGVTAPRKWLEELVTWAAENNIAIAADEGCYNEYYFCDKRPTSILEITKKGVLAFYSLSKHSNMTGYRVGFVAGDSEIISKFAALKSRLDDGLPHFVQEAAIAALNDDEFPALMREEYRKKREILFEAFASLGFPPSSSEATFFVWQKAPHGMNGDSFAAKLLELGIVVIPGSALSCETSDGIIAGQDYVRIALMPTLEQTKTAAKRIKKAFA